LNNLYLAKLVFHVSILDDKSKVEFDEQVRLIKAPNAESAYIKAKILGKHNDISFVNENGKTISWKFIDVTDIICLSDKENGDEIFSTSYTIEDSENYISFARHKAMMLQI
jgi:hypothetical protein